MSGSISDIIPPKSLVQSNITNDERFYSYTHGSVSLMPTFIGREPEYGIYDFMQAFDRAANRLFNEIRLSRLTKSVKRNDLLSMSGNDLNNYSEMIGLSYFENFLYDSFKERIIRWNETPSGGTKVDIRRAIYYYIGSGAFDVNYDIDNGNSIEIINANADNTFWGTTAGTTSGEGMWGSNNPASGTALWGNQYTLASETFSILIHFKFSGSSTDRTHYDFWAIDENRVELQKIINDIKPIASSNTLKLINDA